ncbi:MAG: 30S ribosome-binding factor RbfA [Flavobacteriales bacterium]|jgi:ribosome-binding factor A|nr:30S ribosome-binding factor RbfA [Schleiferiaceae bacterium]|tara:strand:+ start:573 stop:932 length:360 start_codon:yes stop_codon:yes gene_type:complete
METTRQKKIASVLQQDLAEIFQLVAKSTFTGTLITVSKVRVTPDLGLCKVYLSVFPTKYSDEVMVHVEANAPALRNELGQRVRHQLRVVPNLKYYLDDSLDYQENIERLLKGGGENPIR